MIILDTNVLSELMKLTPAPQVFVWFGRQVPTELFITSLTEAETYAGIELLPHGKRRNALMAAAENVFAKDFAGRILSFDSDAARAFAKIVARRRRLGKPIGPIDAQIAAIAELRGAKLATRNVVDFSDCGIDLIDPWHIP